MVASNAPCAVLICAAEHGQPSIDNRGRAFVVTAKPPIRFNCKKCPGFCCSHSRIAVTDNDIRRLAMHFGISEKAARTRLTYRYKTAEIDEQLLRHHKDTIYKSVCHLFDREKRQCTVYAARPNVCRKYPYSNKCGYYEFLRFERAHHGDENFVPTV
jgi:Fe-S-cluster containining protein